MLCDGDVSKISAKIYIAICRNWQGTHSFFSASFMYEDVKNRLRDSLLSLKMRLIFKSET